MGSPIASTIAQLVLEYLEEELLAHSNYDITIFKRYVDDCLIITSEQQDQEILAHLIGFHNKIQFTIEKEKNNSINLLDITIIRNNNKLETKLYRKPTNTDRILDYNSAHSERQKRAIITNYIDRAIKLTSPTYRPTILEETITLLTKNNYPINKIKRILKQRTHKLYNTLDATTKKEPTTYIPIPYIPQLSEKIENILRPYSSIKIAHRPHLQIKQEYSRLKAPTPKEECSHVVYRIPCNDCAGVYVGQTQQKLKDRLKGHKYSKAPTALYKHTIENQHSFDFGKTEILDKEKNRKPREFLEMIHIKQDVNSINDRTDIRNLSSIYSTIIDNTKKKRRT
ncbi:uncharacterized protein LOC123317821 [Coccinella septempunctata]|uniref:uncharacterized protein LOC123317821 n=1 Tax=Coccinella septempunctata TaxID=41139 RepID=UPI001D088450|nr:uncharacterized protein LOC123317821 [Coccinella septempunctata]